jgi:peptide-methionine (S)-S-oxide reductase
VERTATFGAGCFWGVEAAFRQLDGVTHTHVGYSGGTPAHPTYDEVCSGTTGHTEVVEVRYDPERVSYEDLLRVFWRKHDPTRPKRKEQYRSVVFFHDAEQQDSALKSKAREQAERTAPIVTQVEPAQAFYEADEHHQQYLEKHGRATCTPALARVA